MEAKQNKERENLSRKELYILKKKKAAFRSKR